MKSKKIISGLLALSFVFGGTALPNTVVNNSVVASAATSATEVLTYGDFEYTILNDGTVEIAKYIGSDTEVEIPDEIDGAAVTSIGERAFDGNKTITSVTIPEGINNIGFRAFFDCDALLEMAIPDGVKTIGGQVFHSCEKLRKVTMTDSVEVLGVGSLGEGVFGYCTALESVTLSNKLTKINKKTFQSCKSLKEIKLPSGIKTIGEDAFLSCTNLENINLPDGLETIGYQAFENCEKLASISLPDSVTSLGRRVFVNNGSGFTLTIPNSIYAEKHAKRVLEDGTNFKIIDANDKTEYPIPCSAEFNSQYHQFRLNWTAIEGAEKYAIAVYLAGKWRPQVYTDAKTTSFTSPKLKSTTYKMVICARVNGEWDTSALNSRSFFINVK